MKSTHRVNNTNKINVLWFNWQVRC